MKKLTLESTVESNIKRRLYFFQSYDKLRSFCLLKRSDMPFPFVLKKTKQNKTYHINLSEQGKIKRRKNRVITSGTVAHITHYI